MSALDKILAAQGKSRASLAKDSRTRLGKLLRRDGVPDSPEVQRVRLLPRSGPWTQDLVDLLCSIVLEPWSTERPRPIQVDALLTLFASRALFGNIPVGEGKTIITLVAATLLGSERPLLIVPASLRDKTRRDAAALHDKGWRVTLPRIVTFNELSTDYDETLLRDDDLVIVDEAHRFRDLSAACTAKFERWLQANPDVPLALLSGTLVGTRLLSWHHFAEWTLGPERMPLPATRDECIVWGQALDREDPRGLGPSLELGALDWTGGWDGFMSHVLATPGIVGSAGSSVSASLVIRPWRPSRPPAVVREAMRLVTEEGSRPDGELLSDAEMVDTLQQLALGFYYVWDPPPPDGWRLARSEWLALVSSVKKRKIPGLDSEAQIKNWARYDQGGAVLETLQAWEEQQQRYKPPRKAVWLDDSVLKAAVRHARQHNALVWHSYRAVGEKLEQLGLPHFGDGGLDSRGRYIEEHEGPASCSIKANGTGRNLQRWSHNLVLTVSPNAEGWEQLLARTHRPGQTADEVVFDVADCIRYHAEALRRARDDAEHLNGTQTKQKLTIATWA